MAEKTEKVGNTKAAVQAAKIIQGAATAGLPGAAIATISDPKASFALVKKILIAVTVIIMLPTIIISSIPGAPIRNANAIASARPAPHLIAFATKLV